MLHQGIIGVLAGEGDEVIVIEIEVVYTTDQGVYTCVLKSLGESFDQGGLAGALDAVEANDEGAIGLMRL